MDVILQLRVHVKALGPPIVALPEQAARLGGGAALSIKFGGVMESRPPHYARNEIG